MKKNILFIHQNFPGQFKYLAPALAQDKSNRVVAMMMRETKVSEWQGIQLAHYTIGRSNAANVHRWLSDFESKIIRGEACYRKALTLRNEGFSPDLILTHPAWGESLFLKDVWPKAKIIMYAEFFYHSHGFDVGFDPEFPVDDPYDDCRVRIKNANNLLHMDIVDAAISPTQWQKSTFPEAFQKKIKVIHDGIDTDATQPNPNASIEFTTQIDNKKIKLTSQDEVITFVSRNLEPYRGFHIFMRALPEILKKRPRARILIIGDDKVSYGVPSKTGQSWRDVLFNEIKHQLTPNELQRIHFLGHIPYAAFMNVLQISTVHVYLTYPFVLSWSLLEAMSAGCVIVGSNTPPVAEVVSNQATGLLFDFFNHNELAHQVCDVLKDKNRRLKLSNSARQFVQTHYDLNKVCLPQQIKWIQSFL